MNPEKIQSHHEVKCRVSDMPKVASAATWELIRKHPTLLENDILLFTVAIRIEAKEKTG